MDLTMVFFGHFQKPFRFIVTIRHFRWKSRDWYTNLTVKPPSFILICEF